MRIRLSLTLLLVALCAGINAMAAECGIKGIVVSSKTGQPVVDANVLLQDQGLFAMTGSDGSFVISNATPGEDILQIVAFGYEDLSMDVHILKGVMSNLGSLAMTPSGNDAFLIDSESYVFDSDQIADDGGMQQGISTIQGSSSDIFYNTAGFNFSVKRYRFRGYTDNWSTGYINGVEFNEPMRGVFNYSGLGGMTSNAFRNKSTEIGLNAANFGYGSIGGSNNYTTYASEYAPGFRGNVSYTNSNYKLRATMQYSTGLMKNGWALSAAIIGRYAPEGVQEGTFYNSLGYQLSAQKVINDEHSINITTWGAPTERAGANAATQEAYDLAGNNLYNPNWGWLDGKKVSDRVYKTFDPSAVLNWIWKPWMGTTLNTAVAFRHNNYRRSGLDWYQANDPKPNYYKNLPSAYLPTATYDPSPDADNTLYNAQLAQYEEVTRLWKEDQNVRQLDWAGMIQANRLNRDHFDRNPDMVGQSNYVLYDQHSNVTSWMGNSYLNTRISDILNLQGGLSFNYSNAHYYKSLINLLGGEYFMDIDNFSERDFAGDPNKLQNDMNNPNRKAVVGDTYGYDYNFHQTQTRAWLQNEWNTRRLNVNYSAEVSLTDFFRYGNMRNGRNPENSYGNGAHHNFLNYGVKAGATYKANGRNYITAHAAYGTRAPFANDAYVNPQIKDEAVKGLTSERYFATDLGYTWNYAAFRGQITGFYTRMWDGIKHNFFFDYDLQSMMAYAMTGVDTEYKGLELGAEYKVWNGISVEAAATISEYLYKSNPTGTRNANNGAMDDVVRTVYINNYHVGGTPQQVYSLALKYAAPKMWFFELNGQYFADGYVDLAPTRHEEMPGLWKFCTTEEQYKERMAEITRQDKLTNAFVMNASVGKTVYTKWGSYNFNVSVNNLLNNRNIQTGGFQESKFDYTEYKTTKFPNRYWYAQGTRVFINFGIRF